MQTLPTHPLALTVLIAATLALAACGSDSDGGNGGGGGGGGGGADAPSEAQIEAFNEAFCLWTCTDQVECDTDGGWSSVQECTDACPNPGGTSPHVVFGANDASCMALGIAYYQCEIEEGCDVRDTGACDDEQRAYSQGC